MSLAWPWALAALLVVPLLFLVRWWMLRRRRKLAIRVSSLAIIRAALPGPASWKRRIPVILLAVGLVALGVGIARPHATVLVPRSSSAILLAIDVSRSMCSTDVTPNRLAAARDAARQFVQAQPQGTRIGLVAFSGIAGLLVEPTTDKAELLSAIDKLQTARGTAIGQAILTSIDAIAEINPDVTSTGVEPSTNGTPHAGYEPDTIVILTDGRNTQGVDPVTAAEQATARRLRVYTIGFGTTEPAPLVCSADDISDGSDFRRDPGGGFGGLGPNGGRVLEIDEDTLAKVAKMTGGEYFRAQDAKQLLAVLTDLPSNMVLQKRHVEITAWFVWPGTLLVLTAIALSVWWNRSRRTA